MEFKSRVTTSLKFINKTVNLIWYIFRKAGLFFSNELIHFIKMNNAMYSLPFSET